MVHLPQLPAPDDQDFETAQTALLDLPLAIGSMEAKQEQFAIACQYIAARAPATARQLEGLFNVHSEFTGGALLTVQAAFEHLQLERLESNTKATGRPAKDKHIEAADASAARKLAREARQQEKQAKNAAYSAYLERCAHRRDTIAESRVAVSNAQQQRKVAHESMLAQFNSQWDEYIESLRAETRRLESVPAAEWPDANTGEQTAVAIT